MVAGGVIKIIHRRDNEKLPMTLCRQSSGTNYMEYYIPAVMNRTILANEYK
jgi:hypothetical protein